MSAVPQVRCQVYWKWIFLICSVQLHTRVSASRVETEFSVGAYKAASCMWSCNGALRFIPHAFTNNMQTSAYEVFGWWRGCRSCCAWSQTTGSRYWFSGLSNSPTDIPRSHRTCGPMLTHRSFPWQAYQLQFPDVSWPNCSPNKLKGALRFCMQINSYTFLHFPGTNEDHQK